MCYTIGCACLGQSQTGHLLHVAASSSGRFGEPAPVFSPDAVGSFIDRFRWPQPISHDWPTALHNPLAASSKDVRSDRRRPEPQRHLQNHIRSSLVAGIASANLPLNYLAISTTTTMDFSGKDLEDIQRVAGLLNLTVDELLQQSRVRAGDASSSPQQLPRRNASQQPSPLSQASHAGHALPSRYQASFDLDLDSFELGDSGRDPSDLALPPPAAQDQGAQVILLNPHTTSYDCDAALWGFDQPAGQAFPFDDAAMEFDPAEDGSYVPVTGAEIERESISEYTAQEVQDSVLDDASSDWALVSASPGSLAMQTVMSPSSASADKRYHRIAPKFPKSSTQTPSESSSHRVKKKRSPYEGSKRIDTHLTRQLHACVRCRMQRNRCIPDPNNPQGPCLTCQQRTVRMSRLPCLRYMVTDSTLFRTGLDYMAFYRAHPMIGPHHGDFHLERQWTDAPLKILCLGQLGSMHVKIELRQFVPPANTKDVDLKGRPMYAVPWAIADPDAVAQAITEYIDRGVWRYMAAYLDDTDPLVWNIFQAAYRASVFPVPNEMLKKTLKLWVACRFIESKWRCWSETGWADSELRTMNPQDPFYQDLDSPPPYIDYQWASIIIHRILNPLRKDVLRILQSTLNTHSPKDWFATFLTSFILLHNYEMQMLFQRQFAKRREAPVRYLDMSLVRATNSGAKTILAHFHYCYKGQQLFTAAFDWTSSKVRRMARLDVEQCEFMSQCRDVVVQRASTFQSINNSDVYHKKWWYTSQLFDPDWIPRETLEHAPPAGPSIENVV
jgi:hypothetical protein